MVIVYKNTQIKSVFVIKKQKRTFFSIFFCTFAHSLNTIIYIMAKKILFINQEITPYVPETAMSLLGRDVPQKMQESGFEIRTFMPKWGNINERRGQLHEVIRLSGMNLIIDDTDHPLIIKVASIPTSRLQVYFIDNEDYFLRRPLMTTDENGEEYADNGERAIFFARGVLETVKKLRWIPDVIVLMMENTSYMFLTGPKVVKTVTGEDIDAEHLGGASVHASKSGVTSFTAKTEEEAVEMLKTLLSYIPSNNTEEAPRTECTDPINRVEDSLNEILPDDPNKAYDMYKVISAITDNGEFFEVQPKFAKNIITGFARFNGQSVGIVANQPSAYAGVLDTNASRKGARFVRFCDAFNIPIVSLVDVPGFLPGTGQEYNAVILHGAQLLYAYGEATVPKITITLRKSYGGSHIVMGCKQLRSDLNFAWPTAEIAVMGASGAVAVLSAKEAKAKKEAGEDVKAFLAEKEQEYTDLFANPYQAASYGYIDDVIEPRNTRFRICRGLAQLANKRQNLPAKKHGCMPM